MLRPQRGGRKILAVRFHACDSSFLFGEKQMSFCPFYWQKQQRILIERSKKMQKKFLHEKCGGFRMSGKPF